MAATSYLCLELIDIRSREVGLISILEDSNFLEMWVHRFHELTAKAINHWRARDINREIKPQIVKPMACLLLLGASDAIVEHKIGKLWDIIWTEVAFTVCFFFFFFGCSLCWSKVIIAWFLIKVFKNTCYADVLFLTCNFNIIYKICRIVYM